jgi:hypothetical protein
MKYTIRSFPSTWTIFRIDDNDEEVTVAQGPKPTDYKSATELKALLNRASSCRTDEEVLSTLKDWIRA